MVFAKPLLFHITKQCSWKNSVNLARFSLIGKVFNVNFSAVKQLKTPMGDNKETITRFGEIIKPLNDKRCYRGLELENKMKILLVSDPNTDKAAAAITVNVGYFCDPDDIPGLAHFCEHMLFLGTEKYPQENDYAKYIKEHGGYCNALTFSHFTSYYFEVLPEYFEGALDRFAQFFLSPLFTEDATEREINAVNSEFEKNLPIDRWRFDQLDKHISKKDHPFHKFGTGNIKTLSIIPKEKGLNIRNELIKFHSKWYSSNLMSVAIVGKESLDDLEKIAVSKFSNVVNKNVEKLEWTDHPFGPEHLQIKGYIVPNKDIRSISIRFPAPDFQEYYKSCPFFYLSHFIGHEGPGSLLSTLKAKGWCNHLESSYQQGAKGFAFFNIKADLTEEGINYVDDITTLLFQYINMLKREGPQEWTFEEIKNISNIAFQFKEKETPVSYAASLIRNMNDYPMNEVLSGPYIFEEFRPDLIDVALTYLEPKFVRIAVVGQHFESLADETEPWFGTKYKFEKIPPSTIEKWENCGFCEDFKLPKPNSFITSNFEILPLEEKPAPPYPSVIFNTPITRVWFKQDDEFLLPKAYLKFEFICPLSSLDPLNSGLTCMFVQLLRDSLTEYYYYAQLAGLKWSLSGTDSGIMLSISGYNDKQKVLLDKILERMTNFEIDRRRFEFLREIFIRSLKNFEVEQPYQQAVYYMTVLTSEQSWTKEELLKSVDYITYERLEQFIPQLFSKLHVECLFHGNIDKQGAQSIIDVLEKRLTSNSGVLPIFPKQLLKGREVQLVDGTHFMYEMTNDFFNSSCTVTYYQCDVISTQNNMLMELLVQIIQDPCFNILRTKEQLGYIVFGSLKRSHSVQGLKLIVQSDRHPLYIDQRIEAFLIQFREILESMSLEEFERNRESLATVKLEKPKKLSVLSSRFWLEIICQQYHFNRAEVEVAYLRTITKEQLLEFFDKFIKYGALRRRKLSVYILAKAEGGAGNQEEPDAESLSTSSDGFPSPPPYTPATKIEDVTKFKSSHALYPLVQPYMNINNNPTTTKSKL